MDLLITIGSILNVVVEILIIPLNNNVVLVVCILFNCSNSSVISFIPIFPIFHENQSLTFLLCIFCLILQIEVWKSDFLTNSLESRLYLYFGSQVLCQIEIYIYSYILSILLYLGWICFHTWRIPIKKLFG